MAGIQSIKVGNTFVNSDVVFTGAVVQINEQTVDFGVSNKTVILSSADDIQTGINTLNAAGGGDLFLKSGTYVQLTPLVLYSNINMFGDNQGNTTVTFAGTSSNLSMTGTNVYTTGTISSISGGVNVVGSGTTWVAAMVGRQIFISNRWYKIAAVTDTTHLTLTTSYADGTTYSGTYRISDLIHDVSISGLTFAGSTGTLLVATDVRDIVFSDCTYASSNKGWVLTNTMSIDITRVAIASHTSNGYELTNASFFNASDFAVVSNGGLGGVWNNVKSSRVIFSAANANTNDGYNCTSLTNVFFILETSGNGGQGIELVSGCTGCSLSIIASGNTSDGIKITATSNGNNISNSYLTSNGGYGINIAAASCTSNVVLAPYYSGNTSGTLSDSGTTTKVV